MKAKSAAAAEAVVTAGVVVDFNPPGSPNTYRLAAPTFGQAGKIVAGLAATQRPSAALFHDAVRDGVLARGGDKAAELAALVDAFEAADDELQATYAAYGRDDKPSVKVATLALLTAQRGYARAERIAWDCPELVALREMRAAADHAEARLLARETLRGWTGPALPAFAVGVDELVLPDLLDLLPAHEVGAIAMRVGQLTRPDAAAEKN